jgi:hypothetical protein
VPANEGDTPYWPCAWRLSRGDTAALARFGAFAARTARAPATPRAALRARLLGETSVAFLDLARGDTGTAIRKLSAILDTLCLADELSANCFHLNLTLARLLRLAVIGAPARCWSTGAGAAAARRRSCSPRSSSAVSPNGSGTRGRRPSAMAS